jgi:superfamily II DNA or RNA helicase
VDLKESIISILAKSSQPQSARSILAQLEADYSDINKSDVNNVLYGDRALFVGSSFLWSLTAVGHARRFKQLRARLQAQKIERKRGMVASTSLYSWQIDALEAWIKAGQRGIVEAITGSGKTRVGIAAIKYHCKGTGAFAVVLVPTVELMRQWVESIDRQLGIRAGMCGDGRLDKVQDFKVTVYVINSAAEYSVAEVTVANSEGEGLLVADECHRYGAKKFVRALEAPLR